MNSETKHFNCLNSKNQIQIKFLVIFLIVLFKKINKYFLILNIILKKLKIFYFFFYIAILYNN